MKKQIRIWILGISASLLLAPGLMAQERVEMSVQVTRDGIIVKDTTYRFEDASEAKHAMKMMEALSGDDKHMEHVTYNITSTHTQGGHSKAMVFISEDGEEFNITELHSDSLEWISEGDGHHGEHVIIRKSKDGKTFDVLVDEDQEGAKVVKKKEIKVVIPEGEDEQVYIVDGDDDVRMKVIVIEEQDEAHDHDEDVEVKVIKKKVKK